MYPLILFYELVKMSVVLSHHMLIKHALDAGKKKTVRNDWWKIRNVIKMIGYSIMRSSG
jgi:hypothetical protein